MPRLDQVISVNASDQGSQDGKRTLSIKIKLKPELLLLPDMLVQQGALAAIENKLKRAARTAVVAHIEEGRNLIRSMGVRKRIEAKPK